MKKLKTKDKRKVNMTIFMQKKSFSDSTYRNLHIYPSTAADKIKRIMLFERTNVTKTVSYLEDISSILLKSVKDKIFPETSRSEIVPILVMRGGLILYSPCQRIFPKVCYGLVIPYRPSLDTLPKVVYGNLPKINSKGTYLILDLLIASGGSIIATIESLSKHIQDSCEKQIVIIAPFATDVGNDAILKSFPNVEIHTIWHKEKLDMNNRMLGPGFDIGDYAFGGGSGQRVEWVRYFESKNG